MRKVFLKNFTVLQYRFIDVNWLQLIAILFYVFQHAGWTFLANLLLSLSLMFWLETLGLALLDEINNEIVPRWVQIAVSADSPGSLAETVILTDRQPNWDNPEILGALPPL